MVKKTDKATKEAKRIFLKHALPHLGDWMDRLDELTQSSDEKTAVSAVRTGLNFTKALIDDDEGVLDEPGIWDELDNLDKPPVDGSQTPIPKAFRDIDDPDSDA